MKGVIINSVFIYLILSGCSPNNEFIEKKTQKTKCNIDMKNQVENGFLLDQLFDCDKSNEAFDIIKKNENLYTSENYAVTGDILLKHNYIDEAKYYLEKANGDAEAMHRLGVIYAYTKKYKNIDLALKYLQSAVTQGYYFAYVNLADIYLENKSINDLTKAKEYADKAVENGWYEAYYTLAKIAALENKYELAETYLKKLELNELTDLSKEGLSYLYYNDKKYTKYNPLKAKKILESLVETSKDPQRFRWLGDFYMNNSEYKDKTKAIKLYKLALENGDWLSEDILGEL